MKIISCLVIWFKSVAVYINRWCIDHPKFYYFLILSLLFTLYYSISIYQTRLPKEEPVFHIQGQENGEVVGDNRSKRFYYPFCCQVMKIKPENYKVFASEEVAIAAGMKKVKGCAVTKELSA